MKEVRVLQEQKVTVVKKQKCNKNSLLNECIIDTLLDNQSDLMSFFLYCQCVSHSVSVLEREEMDRLLDNTKSELFSEQRRFRHTLDSMQEVDHLYATLLDMEL